MYNFSDFTGTVSIDLIVTTSTKSIYLHAKEITVKKATFSGGETNKVYEKMIKQSLHMRTELYFSQ
jgi:hypothetical protein